MPNRQGASRRQIPPRAAATELFFLTQGHVSVLVQHSSGVPKQLATFSAGMSFGEMALLDSARRSANIMADAEVLCDLLDLADFQALGESHPDIKIKLLRNNCLGLSRKLRKAGRDISVLD